jgi:hypothetical protein
MGEAHATNAHHLITRKNIGDINVNATKTIEGNDKIALITAYSTEMI